MANGAVAYGTSDGLHPSAAIHALQAGAGVETLVAPAAFLARWPTLPFVVARQGTTYTTVSSGEPPIPAQGSSGTTYYNVDPTRGSDSNSGAYPYAQTIAGGGSQANTSGPFKTMGKVKALAAAGVAGTNIVALYVLTTDYIARGTEGANNAVSVANDYHINTTPQFNFISAKSNNLATTWSAVSAGLWSGTRSAATLGVVDKSIVSYPYRISSGGSGYTVGDVLTLPNGAILTVTGVQNGETASGTAGATGAVANWTVTKRPTLLVGGTMTPTGGTGTDCTFLSIDTAPVVWDVPVLAASQAAMVPGTFFDTGTATLYMPLDGRTLSTTANGEPNIVFCVTGNNARGSVTNNQITYFSDGFYFVGGSTGYNDNATATACTGKKLYLGKGAIIGVTGSGNGLAVVGDTTVWAKNHWCYYIARDGHNLHNLTTVYSSGYDGLFPKVFLDNCGGMGNGQTGSSGTSDQNLTGHEQAIVAAVNYQSCGSDDQPIAFVGQSYLWMMGEFAGQANQITPAGS